MKLNLCTICGSNFRTKKALNSHIETVHDGVQQPSYKPKNNSEHKNSIPKVEEDKVL